MRDARPESTAEDFSYHVLERPFPEDFVAWYPYTKPRNMPAHDRWRQWLERVINEGVPGVNDRMIAARDPETESWVGVVWTSVSAICPQVAHFGWFYVEDRCRGVGVGGHIIETCLSRLNADGARAIMLPTQLENERAIGMYYRRGWKLTITDPGGGVWMVREPAGFYESFFQPEGQRPVHAAEVTPGHFVGLDYLLSRPHAPIRLLPVGLVGNRRFISFVHDWGGAEYLVAQQAGRPMALAAAVATDEGSLLDVFGLDRRAMAVAADELMTRVPRPYADVASTDAVRRGALEDAGMRCETTRTDHVAGAEISLCRYVPA